MLNPHPFLTFLIFFGAAFAVHAITMLYYPQYTDLERLVSSLLIATGEAFSIPFIFTRFTDRFVTPKIPHSMRAWFTEFEIVIIFIVGFISYYYGV